MKFLNVLACHFAFYFTLMSAELSDEVKKVIVEKKHPLIACSPAEAERLRRAWKKGEGKEYKIIKSRINRVNKYLKEKIVYPERGGQHNQWYQCDKCEVPLKTLSATQHQCPKCKKIYTGYPYDDVLFARVHNSNLRKMNEAAWAWLITGNKEYAVFAKQILLGYAERYMKYPFHGSSKWNIPYNMLSGGHLFEQTLNEACVMSTRIAPAYDLVKASGVLSPEEDKKITDQLIIPILENIGKYKQGKNNWQSWHNAGMLWGGAVIRSPAWVERAVYDPENGFIKQMKISILEDGMWYEGSWSYHFYAQQALIAAAEGARRLGIDLWSEPQMKKTFTYPLNWSMPGRTLPRFGDSVSPSLNRCRNSWEPAYSAYKDDDLLSVLSDRPTWDAIFYGRNVEAPKAPLKLKSSVYKRSGHAILRAKGQAGLTLAAIFGPHGGYHGHYDKLGFVMYGCGKELAVDPGRAKSQAYRLPIHKQWYKASISHNVVLVDKSSQSACEGKLLLFKEGAFRKNGGSFSLLLLENNNAYPGVKQRRLFLLTENYLFLLDALSSREKRRYDWLYHNKGDSIASNIKLNPAAPEKDYAGMQYLKDIKTAKTGKELIFDITGNGVDTKVMPAAAPGSLYLTATGPGSSVDQRIPMIIVSRTGKETVFPVVIEPVKSGCSQLVQAVRSIGGNKVEIIEKNSKRTISLNEKSVVVDSQEFPF